MIAFVLVVLLGVERVAQVGPIGFLDRIGHFLVNRSGRVHALRLAAQGNQFLDAGDDLLTGLMTELERFNNLRFAGSTGACFHHHDALFGARDDDVQLGALGLVVAGLRDQFPIQGNNAHARRNMMERDIGNRQRRRGTDHAQRRRVMRRIRRHHHCDNLRFAGEAFRKERPHRAVDQAAGQDFFF